VIVVGLHRVLKREGVLVGLHDAGQEFFVSLKVIGSRELPVVQPVHVAEQGVEHAPFPFELCFDDDMTRPLVRQADEQLVRRDAESREHRDEESGALRAPAAALE